MSELSLGLSGLVSWEAIGILLVAVDCIVLNIIFTIHHNNQVRGIMSEQSRTGRIMDNGKDWGNIWRILNGKS